MGSKPTGRTESSWTQVFDGIMAASRDQIRALGIISLLFSAEKQNTQ